MYNTEKPQICRVQPDVLSRSEHIWITGPQVNRWSITTAPPRRHPPPSAKVTAILTPSTIGSFCLGFFFFFKDLLID